MEAIEDDPIYKIIATEEREEAIVRTAWIAGRGAKRGRFQIGRWANIPVDKGIQASEFRPGAVLGSFEIRVSALSARTR